MFCNQCEQSSHGTGCTHAPGVCGKDEDVQSLQEMLLYGLKGMAAYANHARRLGKHDEAVSAFIEEALFATMTNVNFDQDALLELCLECGRQNLRVMELLDAGHVERFGAPSPAEVREGTQRGPGILITGHDLLDLANLLEQCEGTDIGVYTHGEMLPAHMYPRLREHPNLRGHYGGAWQKQKKEFAVFPGPIVATTNCIQLPREEYAGRLFTTRVTAVPGGARLQGDDFGPVLDAARRCAPCTNEPLRSSTIGFHHSVLLQHAGALVDGIRAGKLKRFYLIGGCDGAEPGRNYFTEYARGTSPDSFVLTLGCGKYRIRDEPLGSLLGFPRLLDMGQCNDAYGAIKVALALADALRCGVNELPLTLVISWFEQKAVAVLLTLLALDVQGITLGPNPPPFVTPNVFRLLQQRYGLRITGKDAAADRALAVLQ